MGGGGMEGWEGGKTPPRGGNSHRDPVSQAGSDDDWRSCDADSGVYAAEQSRADTARQGKARPGLEVRAERWATSAQTTTGLSRKKGSCASNVV